MRWYTRIHRITSYRRMHQNENVILIRWSRPTTSKQLRINKTFKSYQHHHHHHHYHQYHYYNKQNKQQACELVFHIHIFTSTCVLMHSIKRARPILLFALMRSFSSCLMPIDVKNNETTFIQIYWILPLFENNKSIYKIFLFVLPQHHKNLFIYRDMLENYFGFIIIMVKLMECDME